MDRIDKVFYINLESRTDRRAEIEEELKTQFLYEGAERFVGITGAACGIPEGGGIYGCTMSHIYLFRRMIINGWDTMMVIEDDAKVLSTRKEIDKYINSFLDDEKGDILCIGNSCGVFERKYNDLLDRCFNTQTSSCYVLKKKFVKTLLDCYFIDPSESMTLMADGTNLGHRIGGIDSAWLPLQRDHYFLMPEYRQVSQRPSFSDIANIMCTYCL
jgi:GR25 family glycosyltransferase involved in LPS biosynthesis